MPWHLPLRRRPIQFLHSRPAMGVFHPLILPGLINRLCWDRGGGWQTEFLSVPEELSSGGADQGTSSPSAGWVGEGGAGAGVTARPEGQRMAETPKYSLAGGWVHGGRHSLTAWQKAEKGSSWGLQWLWFWFSNVS